MTILWQTDEVRHDSLRISDEIRHALWFFEHSLVSAATDLLRDWRERLPGTHPPLRFGAWVGGDMDGNPAAGPASIEEALTRARELALARYRGEVRALAIEIAAARSLVSVSTELDESLARDERELPAYSAEIGARNDLEPYRRKLSFMWWRLGNDGYTHADELIEDVRVIARSLRANGGARVADGRVARLERMVEIFGFHVAKLDIRLHARELGTERAREAVAGAERARDRHGAEALDTLIVSGTASAQHVLAALELDARAARDRAAVRDARRPRASAGDRRRAARRASLRRPRPRAKRRPRGDGRLLGLGQGQRLLRRAVGDLPRAGGARRGRAPSTRST